MGQRKQHRAGSEVEFDVATLPEVPILSTRLMRSRVNERLERATRFPVTLIAAPAGFGKSVALRDFADTSRLDAVRYDVHREDGTLLAFVRRLSETLKPVAPSAIAAFPAIHERVLAADEPVLRLSDWFFEHLRRVVCTIVIDDLHYAAVDRASIALLADLIERTTDRIRWIIAARSDVGLPVASWIAYGRMDMPIGEDDLRFTIDEALASADAAAADLDPHEIEALCDLTEGWPVALAIALRTRTYAADLLSASSGTREMVYRYLAEQVFAGLTPDQRAFVLATCVFSTFNATIAQTLGASPDVLSDIRSKVAFLNEIGPAEYRYHDLFRDFLEAELRRRGEGDWTRAARRGAELLEQRGDDAGALVLYAKAGESQALLRIVDRKGFSMFEHGQSEALSAALDAIPDELKQADAAALGLRATIEASRGRFELAQRGFITAIDKAGDPDLRTALVHRYAIELVRHDRDCVGFLEPYAKDGTLSDEQRVPLLGTLATAYLAANRYADALATIQRALDAIDPSMNAEMLARLYQQAAYIHDFGPERERARTYAALAIELALPRNLFDVAARAYSALFSVAYNEDDDPIACLKILDKLDECARKGAGNQARVFALMAAYELEVERGDDAALERLDSALHENQAALPRARSETFLPADALRAAWVGDFKRALQLLAGTAEQFSSDERRALRAAEIALYAFACADGDRGAAALEQAEAALERCTRETRRTIRSRIFIALAEMLRGHSSAANRHLTQAERALTPQMRRVRALAHAARALYRVQLNQADRAARSGVLERLRAEHFGGIARLIEALPFSADSGQGYGTLTAAEREILQLLARGGSTKDVAARTGRSPHTVDTHIRSICRKLACSGRREAVAFSYQPRLGTDLELFRCCGSRGEAMFVYRCALVLACIGLAACSAQQRGGVIPASPASGPRTVMDSPSALPGDSPSALPGDSPSALPGAQLGCDLTFEADQANCTVAINITVPPVSDATTPANLLSGLHPIDLRARYGLPVWPARGAVAIVDAYDDPQAELDLAVYRAAFGLAPCTSLNGCFRKVNQRGAAGPYPAANLGWDEEISLDLDMVSAACPDCSIVLVEADSASFDDLGSAVDAAALMRPAAISNSYYGPEWSGERALDKHYRHSGIAITVSAGDQVSPFYPAVSPYVTSVGGTTLSQSGGSWNETAWQYGARGCSRFEPKPNWQGVTGCRTRAMTDVAAVADPQTGVAMYDSTAGGWVVTGGTSVGAPLLAAAYALSWNPRDPAYSYRHPSAFHDIAPAGYDPATGLGSPNGLGGL